MPLLNSKDVDLKPRTKKELHIIKEIEEEELESSALNIGYQNQRKSS